MSIPKLFLIHIPLPILYDRQIDTGIVQTPNDKLKVFLWWHVQDLTYTSPVMKKTTLWLTWLILSILRLLRLLFLQQRCLGTRRENTSTWSEKQWEGVVGEEERFVTAFVNQFKNDADLATMIDDDSCMEKKTSDLDLLATMIKIHPTKW